MSLFSRFKAASGVGIQIQARSDNGGRGSGGNGGRGNVRGQGRGNGGGQGRGDEPGSGQPLVQVVQNIPAIVLDASGVGNGMVAGAADALNMPIGRYRQVIETVYVIERFLWS
jgi:hypothetical protein